MPDQNWFFWIQTAYNSGWDASRYASASDSFSVDSVDFLWAPLKRLLVHHFRNCYLPSRVSEALSPPAPHHSHMNSVCMTTVCYNVLQQYVAVFLTFFTLHWGCDLQPELVLCQEGHSIPDDRFKSYPKATKRFWYVLIILFNKNNRNMSMWGKIGPQATRATLNDYNTWIPWNLLIPQKTPCLSMPVLS